MAKTSDTTYKNPGERKHMWERAVREPDPPKVAKPSEYPHTLPRHLHHPDGRSTIVHLPEECEAHLTSGWALDIDRTPNYDDDGA